MDNRFMPSSHNQKRPSLFNMEAADELTSFAFSKERHSLAHSRRHKERPNLKNADFHPYQEESEDKRV